MSFPRTFLVKRNFDETGISGTGFVAEGVVFSNGKVRICWYGDRSMIVDADTLQHWIDIHVLSHPDNRTEIHWCDGTIDDYSRRSS